MIKYNASHYCNYSELSQLLKNWEKSYPHLCKLESIGKSLEGRELWLMTLTDFETGKPEDKSAYWIDGNTHAIEITGSQAALHTIDMLIKGYKKDNFITTLLKDHTFYILPRIAVDGVELLLTNSYCVRSSPVQWPKKQAQENALQAQDINSDGQILKMRVEDKNGIWKISKHDPRIMTFRLPDDIGENGEVYYQIYTEGAFQNYGGLQKQITNSQRIDFNRQYPADWLPEGEQKGAGPFPLSQPETYAIVKAITDRPNIVGAQSYHTFSGIILRPFNADPDERMDLHDFTVYETLGKRGEEITGYKCVSIYHDYRYNHDDKTGGSFTEWAYKHLGLYVFTTELWNIGYKAGISIERPVEWIVKGASEEEEIKIIQWCDQNLEAGSYFADWTKFKHPQLGDIEIGGWKYAFTWSNPPPEFLEEEVEKNVKFTLSCAASNPKIHFHTLHEETIGFEQDQPLRKIKVIIENKGYLPTYGSKRALKASVVAKPKICAHLIGEGEILFGGLDFETEHLEGRTSNYHFSSLFLHTGYPNKNIRELEWVIKGKGDFKVEIYFQRGGKLRHTFTYKP